MRRLLLYAIVVACLPLFSCSSNDDLEKRIVALEAKGSETVETPAFTDTGPAGAAGAQGEQGPQGPAGA